MSAVQGFAPIVLNNLNKPWEQAFSHATRLSFPAKKIISSRTGLPAHDGMYYIAQGRIRLSYIAANGAEKVLFYLGSGTLFNEIPMLVSSNVAVFTATMPTIAYFWKRKCLPNIFLEHPELINNMLESLSIKCISLDLI